MTRISILIAGVVLTCGAVSAQKRPVDYVNPLIGTARMGHTFPGATVPFGSVQLSPETDTLSYEVDGAYNKDVYRYCAGYQYEDKSIVGFSHTHFSGTGHSDLGDFLIMPTVGELKLNPGTADDTQSGYRSKFSHDREVSEANYYKVMLDDYNITAELTTSERVGFHRYTFPKTADAHVVFDLKAGIYNYDGKNVWTFVRVVNDTLITGYRQTSGWARTRTVYFAMTFSKPFTSYGRKSYDKPQAYKGFWRKFNQEKNFADLAGRDLTMYFDFDTRENDEVLVKLALSPVSQQNALANLNHEIPHWNFDSVKAAGQDWWNNELSKIDIETISEDDKVNFYTSMYHTFLGPTVYMDANGQYRGLDQENHVADGFVNYTTFSLWDTFRALHPYFNIVQPRRNADMVTSMLAHYDQSVLNMLPIWSHYANDNWCMSGYHAVSVIADAIVKGVYTGDAEKALEACIATSNRVDYEGIGEYIHKGYIPADLNSTSVSSTLEYAYDDWCIAQIAKKLGKEEVYQEYMERAGNWKNVFDERIGFMRPKNSDGEFVKDFDVLDTHGQGFIEGNSWNYSLFIPHDPNALITLHGGKEKFAGYLDSLFTMELPDKYFENTEDISRDGIIGNYVHGNEPSHHVAYLYNYVGQPWKTQKQVRYILNEMYQARPDGLGGNDDCGQMSAWYIFGALGFYPISPGALTYDLGSPLIKRAELNLENGNTFTVVATNQSPDHVYVSRVLLNGTPLKRHYITHKEIMGGGVLEFVMSKKPNKK
ncbi:GH92 family glycosyl hydrolase [Parapedobacter indicus]|uniref:Alpha-1,2-mannosidase, putative n=1 Tax=Parapedobacter indicus TaxID=1477437 RepID=A0A1I3FF86_9SPHI|nr:GH92 family glycosyl hydrolase [Parapedobacter indicus]PPL03692.1 putative alpha-1,2-mannosidase [Parapedobacter indicus]SFI09752.1 alpha-1,2-mannosidase, putative [Parapedobacter indicus]